MNCLPVVEHALMDSAHRALFEWTSESALRLRDLRPFDECIYALDVLTHLTRSHFAHEEVEMRAMRYPTLRAHTLEHRRLLGDLAGLRTRLAEAAARAAGLGLRRSAADRLSAWMLPHVAGPDRGYAAWLRDLAPVARACPDPDDAQGDIPCRRSVTPPARPD
jgi:hemerythrin-like metal-binding protein